MVCTGAGTSLANIINEYFKRIEMSPGMIQSIHLTSKPGPVTQGLVPCVTVQILYSTDTRRIDNNSVCTARVVCEDRQENYCDEVDCAINNSAEKLWHDSAVQDAQGTYYWVGIFAP